MASTRDKRLKTDSPTPVQPNDTATTPTSKASTAIKLKRMSRNRSGVLSEKPEKEDGNDSLGLSEDTQSSTASVDAPKTPNTRTRTIKKEEEANGDVNDADDIKDGTKDGPETPRTRKLTKAQMLKKKVAELAIARRTALMKRKSLPLPVKSSLRNIARRLSGGGKLTESSKEEQQAALKKSKAGRKVPVEKKESEAKEEEEEEVEPEAEIEEEIDAETDIVAEPELEPEGEAEVEKIEAEETIETELILDANSIKQEKLATAAAAAAAAAIDLQNVRRSTRQRKSTIKVDDRESLFTGRKSLARDKSESKRDSISPALSTASIKAEKESSKAISITVDATETTEKDPSLSPELVSEEMDTESVQHLYDKPDFLENNLGIEKDPKLGEIVKVQEKTKVVEVIKMEEEVAAAVEAEKPTEKKVNGNKIEKVGAVKDAMKEVSVEVKTEVIEPETKAVEPLKDEESAEENKENEGSAKSVGGGSPRSDGGLKSVNEENVPKLDVVDTELFKQKEIHFLTLGLLTHKAADEEKQKKIREKEEYAKTQTNQTQSGRSSKSKKDSSNDQQYTGTLKTIIKLNRSEKEKEKRKTRMPLKMTFQKKNRDRDSNGSSNSSDSFYTIQEKDANSASESHGAISRKSHNRSYNHDQVAPSNEQNQNHEPVVNQELDQSLVIPEKASSFKVHPERLCKDQCFYCGGKFGLYDTPCHIAQIKSTERQKKILDSEEKLTKDSCLCDACFRHVDRRANCPSYKSKRLAGPAHLQNSSNSAQQNQNTFDRTYGICNVIDCNENAVHNIRKKWFMKMKKTIAKIFQIDMDIQPTNANVSICEEHFSALSHIMVCAMCKRKLPRNHIFYINQEIVRLEHLIAEQGLHIKLANSTLVVCKLCSYYNNLLFKPPEPKTQKADFVKNYTKKLMKNNDEGDDDDVQEVPLRTDNLTLTIRNGKIQPKKASDRLNKEVTITSMKGSSAPGGGHIMLDNDVMVGYDVPFPLDCESPPTHSIRNPNYKGPASDQNTHKKRREYNDNNDMARALKSNPNISMRELFPGEEEMGLSVTLPFNTNSSQRTADGWVKAQMTVQYDEVTKALWEHLQRPYGNQSSFLRHLILLEKYYRNGDLVLSPSASNSAITYSESVRNRLRSYDNLPSSSPVHSATFSNEISIIPTQKSKGKTSDSLTITPQPQAGNSLLKRKASQPEASSPKQKHAKTDDAPPKKSAPPELISFTQKPSSKSKEKSGAKETSESPPAFMSQSISITATSTPTPNAQGGSNNGNIIVLPETLSREDRKQCTKSWRPTLIPITSGSSAMLNAGGPLFQTADGRKLPALVQVMSGGKPYHISIKDYNRMCIIRREKLQQQMNQKSRQMNQNTSGGSPSDSNSSGFSSNNSLSIIAVPKEKDSFKAPAPSTSPRNTNKMNIPNQILEQNSLIPLNSSQESNGKRYQNGSGPPPLTSAKGMNIGIPPSSALSDLSKAVNSLQPQVQLAAWRSLFNDNEININSDNMQSLAQIASLLNMGNQGGMMMDSALLSKIPKSLTVIPQAKNDRRSSDEQTKHNSAST